ncbi:MAG TPA: aminotransferase class I/II-fold pyridoxal phosphate-dependent enzyme, partial [Ignavibacteriaceae bacterium]|nr:aminotransferase class I/II-fold pyridoxal phosphate-dependent enzyme [Ignavibacteriaceae bacterium]
MNIPFLDLSQQYHCIKDEINKTIEKVLENSSFIKGEEVEKFERDFASIHNVKNCVGVANGTDALIIALKVLNIGQGDEVIVPANSFIATSEAVSAVGAKVVFVDNDPSSYCMDINKIKEKITPETKAVIPVHLYGQAADMDPLMELAKTNGIRIIEDSA